MINIRVHRVYEFSLFFRKDSSKYKRVEQSRIEGNDVMSGREGYDDVHQQLVLYCTQKYDAGQKYWNVLN